MRLLAAQSDPVPGALAQIPLLSLSFASRCFPRMLAFHRARWLLFVHSARRAFVHNQLIDKPGDESLTSVARVLAWVAHILRPQRE